MVKGKELKEEIYFIESRGQKYSIMLDMNALCELEEMYGDIKKAIKEFKDKPLRTVRAFIYAMLKSDTPDLTLDGAGKLIDAKNFNSAIDTVSKIIEDAFPEKEDKGNDIVKNV